MNQKHSRPKLNRYTAGILVLLFAATIYSAVMVLRGRAETIPSIEPTLSADVKSQFSFSASDAPDWRQGPANKTSLALFYNPDDCFTSVEHNEGTVDAAAKLQESQKSLANSGYASTPGPVLTASLQTSTGSQQYQLHQYAVTGTGSGGKLYAAHAYGYLQLPNSYMKIQAYCDNVDNLAAVIPALQAIRFDKAN